MNKKNLLIIAIFIAVPLALFIGAEAILADNALGAADSGSGAGAPTAFMVFDSVKADWNNYNYDFFDTKTTICSPEEYNSNPRTTSFAPTPYVTELAKELTQNLTSELEKAYNIFQYVSKDISYTIYTDKWRTPEEVLSTMDGDCTDKSILLVSLLREAGIYSLVTYGGENETTYQHAWVVANVDGKWFEMDATADDFYYVYKCKDAGSDCLHSKYYTKVLGVFGPEGSLKCAWLPETSA